MWERFVNYWIHRRTVEEYVELNRLLIKAGRRCAYDLLHAHAEMKETKWSHWYHRRANHWLSIFDPCDDGKNYRDRLHNTIMKLEDEVKAYQKLLEKHGIEDDIKKKNEIPF